MIKCLYQLVFKFGQFLEPQLTYVLNYCRFYDFDPFRGPFCPCPPGVGLNLGKYIFYVIFIVFKVLNMHMPMLFEYTIYKY